MIYLELYIMILIVMKITNQDFVFITIFFRKNYWIVNWILNQWKY